MSIAILLFFAVLAIASLSGLTSDSHDSGDWKATSGGVRAPNQF